MKMDSLWDRYRHNSRGWEKDGIAKVHIKIYLGSCLDVIDEVFKTYKISHVVNCAFEYNSPAWFKFEHPDKYACISAIDNVDVNITTWYPVFKNYMDKFIQDKECTGIYVHCQAGMNRSAFLLLTYMCLNFGYNVETMIKAITIQRPCAFSNVAFRDQVIEYIKKHS